MFELRYYKINFKKQNFQSNNNRQITLKMSDYDKDDLEFDIGDQEEEFRDHDQEDGHEQYEDEEQQQGGQHIGYYRDDNKEYDLDMSFEKDLDRLTKVKAQLMFNLNKERQNENIPLIYEDISLASIAQQYAQSLKTSSSDESYLKRLCDQVRNDVDFRTCEIISNYEQDVQVSGSYTEKYFIQTSYLFLQMDKEREILMDPNNTHVGIGIAGNQSTIAIVILVAQRQLTILQIQQTGENTVQLRGKMLDFATGICGVKIYSSDFKEIASVLYDKIDFDRTTREFIVYLQLDLNWKERRWVELHIRQSPESIAYRKPRKDKDKDRTYFKHLKMRLRSLFIPYPDKRYINYYNELIENQNDQNSKLSNMVLESLHNDKNKGQQDIPEHQEDEEQNQQDSQEEEDDDNDEEEEKEAQDARIKEQMSSNKQIKEELQMAINEAKNTYDTLIDTNRMFQGKIKELRQKNHILLDKTGQASMNEHKYLNILAQVHQTRVELQQTQDRYNRMSLELQNKLNQKQSKCNEIRSAFQDLKRQVARKATYSRSDQPIKAHKIQEWEFRQSQITEELQNLRLQILRARNTLDKNQKILKKKEELAEGLHLIDFEQLKIQNQTLNEKIEERNQDLHKLKKKTTTMVQILTHTRQKLVFVEKNKDSLLVTLKKLDSEIQVVRNDINSTKDNCEKLRLEIQDAKQQTEIVNSQELVVDFKRRAENIKKLEKDINEMLQKEKEMKTVIEMYQRKIKKEAIGR